jgi:hypothetical protein
MTEIFIAGHLVYSGSDVKISLNKSISEILEPDKRKSDYTRTIDIIGTPESDKVFMAQFDVNGIVSGATFDPSKKVSGRIIADSEDVLNGYCQLTDVVVTDEDNVIYRVVFYGKFRDFFNKFEDKKLHDIDFSDLDHDWRYSEVQPTWAAPIGVGYVYPLFQWAQFRIVGTPVNDITDFRPFLYVKEIWDRIFAHIGVAYESDFINSDKFKRLIYAADAPYKRPQTDIDNSNVIVSIATSPFELNSTNTSVVIGSNVLIPFNNVVADPGNQWDATFTLINVAVTGRYRLGAAVEVTFVNNSALTCYWPTVFFQIQVERGGIIVENLPVTISQQSAVISPSSFLTISRDVSFTNDINLQAGDKVFFVYVNSTCRTLGSSGFILRNFLQDPALITNTIDVNVGSTMNFRLVDTVVGGDTIDVAKFVAGEQPIKEFMLGLTKMFNLYFEFKPNGVLKIEPRDEGFYTNEIKDLTPKLAVDREFTIKPLEQSKYRFYQYKYKDSNDRLHKAHRDNYGESFGETIIEIENFFTRGVKTIEIPFKIPILANEKGVNYLENTPPLPTVLNDNGQGFWQGDGTPIVALYGGLVSTLEAYLIFDFDTTLYPQGSYPYAGYLDNLTTPTFDLCFDLPSAVYYQNEGTNNISILENGQLYKQFHEVEIQQLTNRNSKVVECYIQMDAALYAEMSFRKVYFIRNAYYRLYEIEAFDPESNDPTKCVFLKLAEFSKAATTVKGDFTDVGGGGSGDENDGESVDVGVGNTVGENSLVAGLNNQVVGSDVVLIGHNFVELGINEQYLYTGVEGSPFYIIISDVGVVIDLVDNILNIGKVVNISSTSLFNLNLNDISAGYHVYFCNSSGNWIKLN